MLLFVILVANVAYIESEGTKESGCRKTIHVLKVDQEHELFPFLKPLEESAPGRAA